jgi:IS5 family transposase
MLRIYFLQQWFDMSDPQVEDEIYESMSMRRFVGVELGEDKIPDETTILRFRHLLEKHDLRAAMFREVRGLLEEKRLLLKAGTIVDATIIQAPSSTKNRAKPRDPEMRQTKKGNPWYFGMKVHVGTDVRGRVHHLTVTDAAQADINQMPDLLHGQESVVYGDKAYWAEEDRKDLEALGISYRINRRGSARNPLTPRWKEINRSRSKIRARGEHAFHVVKRLWGFSKVRYRGLRKNRARVYTAFALANLYMVRKNLAPQGAKCVL